MAFSFDFDTWRENMPLQLMDYVADEDVQAVIVIAYRDKEDEENDFVEMIVGAEQMVSPFLLLGILEAAQHIIHERNTAIGEE
ncbi:MAG: hypothetical protein WC072_06120 [Methanoregulaceae archaeon]